MKNDEVRMNNEKAPQAQPEKAVTRKPRSDIGAESQLHNYNVQLSRLGDLFGNEEEALPREETDETSLPAPSPRPKK